jgi:exodeoxyribonuclease VII large subunit
MDKYFGSAEDAPDLQDFPSRPEFSVGDLSRILKRSVEEGFRDICVRGEVVAPKKHTSGHLYFALKDDTAVLDAVCWRGNAGRAEHCLQEGAEVVCRGRITTYPLRSKYQLVVDHVSLTGEGALLKLLEQLKAKLRAEGLFELAHKKTLPLLPLRIGVITSATGAVIQDILHRLRERLPSRVILWPVNVQGDSAISEICLALDGMNRWSEALGPRPDVIILARGGGSSEDLMVFNSEQIVRAVFASQIPVVSAIGHETDTTLVDYVADVRAPTPTAAAEMVVPVRERLLETLSALEGRAQNTLYRTLERLSLRLQLFARTFGSADALLGLRDQQLDDLSARLLRASDPLWRRFQQRADLLFSRLQTPEWACERARLRLDTLTHRLTQSLQAFFIAEKRRFQTASQLLESLSYKRTLDRGFCAVRLDEGGLLTSSQNVPPQTPLQLHFADGVLRAVTP